MSKKYQDYSIIGYPTGKLIVTRVLTYSGHGFTRAALTLERTSCNNSTSLTPSVRLNLEIGGLVRTGLSTVLPFRGPGLAPNGSVLSRAYGIRTLSM